MLHAVVLALASQVADPQWHDLSNLPGWQGYGTILPSGWISPTKFRRIDRPEVEVPPAGPAPAMAPQRAQEPRQATRGGNGDPYGFVAWLNALRAARGLGAVAHDPNLSAWAATNSSQGYGHNTIGPARRQNVGWGDATSVWNAWAVHGPHATALFDPTLQWVGIACTAGVWSFNGR